MIDINVTYASMLEAMVKGDMVVSRNGPSREISPHLSTTHLVRPVVTCPSRKLSYGFMLAEAIWILTGSNKLDQLVKYAPSMKNYSNDGIHLDGAYGPRILPQIRYVVDCLCSDFTSRQAVLSIWQSNPYTSRDIPCTLTMQFVIRRGYLHCFVNMRSSDVWLGWPYDTFSFSMVALYVFLHIKYRGFDSIKPGLLHNYAASRHVYDVNLAKAIHCANQDHPMMCEEIRPIDIYEFNYPDDLVMHLECLLMRERSFIQHKSLSELCISERKNNEQQNKQG